MFQKDRFVEDCKLAVGEGQSAVRELVLEAVADPSAIIAELGEPTGAGVYALYHADDLTVINFVWAPYMTLPPHNHNMFWRRIDNGAGDGTGSGIEAAGAESLGAGGVATLGRDIIHSVANPITKLSSAIHVYGGNFFDPPEARSQWDHETLIEQPWDMDHTREVFRQAEIRYNAGLAAGA